MACKHASSVSGLNFRLEKWRIAHYGIETHSPPGILAETGMLYDNTSCPWRRGGIHPRLLTCLLYDIDSGNKRIVKTLRHHKGNQPAACAHIKHRGPRGIRHTRPCAKQHTVGTNFHCAQRIGHIKPLEPKHTLTRLARSHNLIFLSILMEIISSRSPKL